MGKILKSLGFQLFVALTLLWISRIFFIIHNKDLFDVFSVFDAAHMMIVGLRFDLSALLAFNIGYIFIYLLPNIRLHETKAGKGILLAIYVFCNGCLLALNYIDQIYYRFTFKRSTADLLGFLEGSKEIYTLIPRFLADYWYILLIWGVNILILYLVHKRSAKGVSVEDLNVKLILKYAVSLVLVSGVVVVGIRGGVQLKPISPIHASEFVRHDFSPMVLNTPFSIMRTYGKKKLEEKKYYTEDELKTLFNPVHHPSYGADEFRPLNVVLVIMESFSKEYMGAPHGQLELTPFLDSLANKSLFFPYAYANGKKSIESLPSILASLPALMDEPYINSVYSSNSIDGLGTLLKKHGYYTSFYHGGVTGTMGFNAFSSVAGFDNYYGMEDYPDQSKYDGNWGIYDEPFFEFVGDRISQQQEPFASVLFSLSSHHPFELPEEYKGRFPEGVHPITKTVQYADHALKKFFEQVRKEPWFDNTLFVITADHTGPAISEQAKNRNGFFNVPVLFFHSKAKWPQEGLTNKLVQHIDLLPSILDYLRYPEPFFSFGQSVFDPNQKTYTINYLNQTYFFQSDSLAILSDGQQVLSLFNSKGDPALKQDMLSEKEELASDLIKRQKAIIQWYHSSLIHNKLNAATN